MYNEYRINNTVYLAQIDQRTNTVYVHGCHPYDDQEYYWARRSERTGNWIVFRNGTMVSYKAKTMSEKDIAVCLEILDRSLNPIMCHN